MDNSKQIIALYDDYNTIIKPLIAEVEARTEQFPLPLFNEIRALHDHIARCYFKDITPEEISKFIKQNVMYLELYLTAISV